LGLVGCVLSRPSGAYDPVYPDEDASLRNLDAAAAVETGPPPPTMPLGGDDAGVGEGGTTVLPTYPGMVGTFLVRYDEKTTDVANDGALVSLSTIDVVSRYSLLYVAQKGSDPTSYNSREYLCHETLNYSCQAGCTKASAQIPSAVDDLIAKYVPPMDRMLTFQNGRLAAPSATTFVGYDGTKNPTPPEQGDTTDSRIWDSLAGGGREGLYTALSLTTSGFPSQTVMCQEVIVQKLVLNWQVSVPSSKKLEEADPATAIFDSSQSETNIVDAQASPTSYRNNCLGKSGTPPNAQPPITRMRFARPASSMTSSCPPLDYFLTLLPDQTF
jgi:hypothetical protein